MFRGIHVVNIDAKGRLAIPKRYRVPLLQQIGQQNIQQETLFHLIATIDTESSCLLLYPVHEWEIIETKLQGLSSFNQATRRIQRLLLGHASELEMDSNGRVLLPSLLRDYANLTKRTVLVGQGKKFELWDEEQWNENRKQWLAEEINHEGELPDELKNLSL